MHQSVTNPVTGLGTTVSGFIYDPAGTPTAGAVAFVRTADGYVFLVKLVGETFYNSDTPPVPMTVTAISGSQATISGEIGTTDIATGMTTATYDSYFAAGSNTPGTVTPPDNIIGADGVRQVGYGDGGSNGHAGAVFVPPGSGGDGDSGPSMDKTLGSNVTTGTKIGWEVGSVGGKGGKGGNSYLSFWNGRSGGDGGAGGTVHATQSASSTIATTGDGHYGIFAYSRSGEAGDGGSGYAAPGGGTGGHSSNGGSVTVDQYGHVSTTGQDAHGIFALSVSNNGGNGGSQWGLAGETGSGGYGGNGGTVTVTTHAGATILTTGNYSNGILAQSIGGSGGSAGSGGNLIFTAAGPADNGGNGGEVHVTNGGAIETRGDYSRGIVAQSIGGGGGSGGTVGGLVALGGVGSNGGGGSAVSVNNAASGTILTGGRQSDGIMAQSIGGSGGQGTDSYGLVGIGGSGSKGGGGSTVNVGNTGRIETRGNGARGIIAQSIGGGGGDGGSSGGMVAVGGSGDGGGSGNTVTVGNDGLILTGGDDATGILAQSIGGGGGNGGSSGAVGAFVGVGIGGSGAGGGAGGAVNVSVTDNDSTWASGIHTKGDRSLGIFGQSVGGGGGNGGGAVAVGVGAFGAASVAVGGSGGAGGAGGMVRLTGGGAAAIQTEGADATGVLLQSVGGGGGNGGYAVSVAASGGLASASIAVGVGGGGGNGGAGGTVLVGGLDGGNNLVTAGMAGDILTQGPRSAGMILQSVGGGGGNGGLAIAGTLTGSLYFSAGISVGIGGAGGSGGTGGEVRARLGSNIVTLGDSSAALLAQSVGGGGGNGGGSIAAGVSASGGGAGSINVGVGGSGGNGGAGGLVELIATGHHITTSGQFSGAVIAQSVGGGGGNGGYSIGAGIAGAGAGAAALSAAVGGTGGLGGAGGRATANVTSDVTTEGADSGAILVQSVGGGGGNGGFAVAAGIAGAGTGAGSITLGLGGAGEHGGAGGEASVTTGGTVETLGDRSAGVVVQSIGGGGGNGGFSVSGGIAGAGTGSGSIGVALGGAGNGGGAGGTVTGTVNGPVATHGADSTAVLAQSVGGGGGNGGFSVAGTIAGAGTGSGAVSVGLGGAGGTGSNGGSVTLSSSAAITTAGDRSSGLVGQSIGGGGGNGGFNVSAALAGAGTGAGSIAVGLGGSGGGGGNGGAVHVTSSGDIETLGASSSGFVAQSVGGGGGNGGFNVSAALAGAGTGAGAVAVGLGGSGAGGGNGGAVTALSRGAIHTVGFASSGFVAQSIGGGGGNGGFNVSGTVGGAGTGAGSIAVGLGGNGAGGGDGGGVTATVKAGVVTEGDTSTGILAQSVGGGGGNGGFNVSGAAAGAGEGAGALAIGLGGSGAGGGKGGSVNLTVTAGVSTRGRDSGAVIAQSIGGGGGNGGFDVAASGAGAGTGAAALSLGIGGAGGAGGDGGHVESSVTGDLATLGANSGAMLVQSVGGGGGNGGMNVSGALSFAGTGAGAAAIGIGGWGGDGGIGGTVEASYSGIALTSGARAAGLVVQSLGGGGGNGGINISGAISVAPDFSGAVALGVGGFGGDGGAAGNVTHTASGYVQTQGADSTGILTQSLGGGGGNGGLNVSGAVSVASNASVAVGLGVGGFGGGGADAGALTAARFTGGVLTTGVRSGAIATQSIGGGGGNGGTNVSGAVGISKEAGGAVSIGVGGFGGGAGNGGRVTSTVATTAAHDSIVTLGDASTAVLAQSVGGGGGNGGLNVSGAVNISGKSGAAVALGLGGFGGGGGDAGSVSLDVTGTVATFGNGSDGVVAQSLGGGGGRGGIDIAGSLALTKPGGSSTILSISAGVGGFGGGGGDAGDVSLSYSGSLTALPRTIATDDTTTVIDAGHASGIVAQSVGGGGGAGGINVSAGLAISSKPGAGQTDASKSYAVLVGVGGFGGTGGDAGNVDVTVASGSTIRAHGVPASGILAQSVGGGGGNGGLNVSGGVVSDTSLIVGVGGFGGNAGKAGDVTVTATADITVTTDPAAITDPTDDSFEAKMRGVFGDGVVNDAANSAIDGVESLLESKGLKQLFVDMGLFRSEEKPDTEGSAGLMAQSVGGGGGNGGLNVSGGIALSKDGKIPSITFGIGGFGGAGNVSGDVSVDHAGTIVVAGNWKHGIFAQSIAGGGGNGGFNVTGQLNWGSSEGTGGATDLSIVAGLGGHGGTGDDAGDVLVVSTGDISTQGYHARGIFAQSIGGGGGTGGVNVSAVAAKDSSPIAIGVGGFGGGAGNAGDVTVLRGTAAEAAGLILTDGTGSHGIEASSIGGGGGDAGVNAVLGFSKTSGPGGSGGGGGSSDRKTPTNSGVDDSVIGNYNTVLDQLEGKTGTQPEAGSGKSNNSAVIAIGGSAGDAGNGGNVTVTHFGDVVTLGEASHGVFGQSVGGGGGNAAFNMGLIAEKGKTESNKGFGLAIGGGTGDGGTGGNVHVANTGDIHTAGDESYGIFAQSVGGGGGNASFSSVTQSGDGGNIGIMIGRTGGTGGAAGAVFASSDGTVFTEGVRSHALFAQSVGNGGGNSGTTAVNATLPSEGDTKGDKFSLSVGLEGGEGGTGGPVTVEATGLLHTRGDDAKGIFAQSIGGGGGNGGAAKGKAAAAKSTSYSLSIGGTGGKGGTSGAVIVTTDAVITTEGARAIGIHAQSVGGAGGTAGAVKSGTGALAMLKNAAKGGETGTSVAIDIGGTGGEGMTSGDVTVTSDGAITTLGDSAHGILAQSIGGGGGMGSLVENSIVNLRSTIDTSVTIAIGGNGGAGAYSGNVSVTNTSDILTGGARAAGILAQAVGGGGGDAQKVQNTITGKEADNSTRNALLIGGSGGTGGFGGNVTVVNAGGARIVTTGEQSFGIFAQSVGGGGGNGSDVQSHSVAMAGAATGSRQSLQLGLGGSGGDGGTGGTVTVTNAGLIHTEGAGAHGILAQSVGGGGGNGGSAMIGSLRLKGGSATDPTLALAIGGSGGSGNTGGTVTVTNSGVIEVSGAGANGILAQSVGGGGGNGGIGIAISASDLAAQAKGTSYSRLALGGAGGDGADGGDVIVNHSGTIAVAGDNAYGILAQSVGGGGGNAGLSVSTPAVMAADYIFSSVIGARTGTDGHAGTVTVISTGDIVMTGNGGQAILAQSINGGGGNIDTHLDFAVPEVTTAGVSASASDIGVQALTRLGGEGLAGVGGADVTQSHEGDIATGGDNAGGLILQSIGGGGGTSRFTLAEGFAGTLSAEGWLGAVDTDNSPGGAVDGSRTGDLLTLGKASPGSVVQSIGGGGGQSLIAGAGGGSGQITLGADPSHFNPGGAITLALAGDVVTTGDLSSGQVVQSIGAGGGEAYLTGLADASVILGAQGGSTGDGGAITFDDHGDMTTSGRRAHGFVLQSIGGGGGLVETDLGPDHVTVTPSDDNGGNGGTIHFDNHGHVLTAGDDSVGILAQSLGGGGGSVDAAFRGSAGGDGAGGVIGLTQSGNVMALGEGDIAVMAQSAGRNGAGNITVALDGVIIGGSGGVAPGDPATPGAAGLAHGGTAAIVIDGGAANTVTLAAGSFLMSLNERILSGGAGDEAVTLAGGGVGNVDLGGGTNGFTLEEGGSFTALDRMLLGDDGLWQVDGDLFLGGTAYLVDGNPLSITRNAGDFAVTTLVSQTTEVTGSLKIGGTASYSPDVFFRQSLAYGGESDLIDVSKDATIAGTVKPQLRILERAGPLVIINPEGVRVDAGTTVIGTPVLTYSIGLDGPTGDGSTIDLIVDPDYVMPGMNLNQRLTAGQFNTILKGHGSAAMGPMFTLIALMDDEGDVIDAIDRLGSEDFAAVQVDALHAGLHFADSMQNCDWKLETGGCWWLRVDGRELSLDATADWRSLHASATGLAGGVRVPVGNDLDLGLAAGFENFSMTSGERFSAEGNRISLGAALSRDFDGWNLMGMISGSTARYRTTRWIGISGALLDGTPVVAGTASAHERIGQANLRLSAKFRQPLANGWYLRPGLQFDASYLNAGQTRETGTDFGLVLTGTEQWVLAVTPSLEVGVDQATSSGGRVHAYARGEVSFANRDSVFVNATFPGADLEDGVFRNYSQMGRRTVRAELGVQFVNSDQTRFFNVAFRHEESKRGSGNAFSMSAGMRF